MDWSLITSLTLKTLAWLVVATLVIGGFVGTILPFLPGTVMIFLGALAHKLMLGPDHSIEMLGFIVLGLLVAAAYFVEVFSSAAGAKWFGASKWGAIGAIVGGIAGIFFMPLGLILGPLLGAFSAEMLIAKKKIKPATKSGVGTAIGTAAGMAIKLVIAGAMVIWIIIDIFFFTAPF